jgi:uncharacterized cupredoxin-like copper-binding protein
LPVAGGAAIVEIAIHAAFLPEKGPSLMRKFGTAVLVGAASLTLLLSACGGGGDASPTAAKSDAPAAGGAVALKMEDIKFDKTALSATVGQPLTINLQNVGALEHDFTIDKIDAKAMLDGKDAKTEKHAVYAHLKAKTNGKLELTPAAAGTFEYYCAVAGHKEAGMKGTLTVK